MHSVQAGMWDPRPPSKHASPLPQPPHSNLRFTNVTTATPAKRITFYKSGDSQFGGIRMAVHKRSFKCFDTLLDDLSQKMPLPFGVRTVTTPRGTHTIQHLEQLQDGGCYLCSDRRQAKPINMELASKRPNTWYHHSHRPHPPETSSATPPGHLPFRQRRILLVKNSEPGRRRSVMLSRRSARSLRAFLNEVSEVMQFHVRKLYTAEGCRIDSVQNLMTCPDVLVCVGREAFSPMLVNVIRKSSEEKLPTLGNKSPCLGPRPPGNGARSPATQGARSPPHGSHSRASENSEGHESKKNVNFGLETKKSIIHPRSDSSNRSAHFSMSSEKSYGNGVGAYSQARPIITNEDIEKRVLVNKDGSLSLEMRVRFRLQNDETLQWSTQVKKSPSLSNECCPLTQAQPYYLRQGQSESCSDPDSTSFDSNQPLQGVSEGKHCPCCCQRQEHQYDLWENPVHSHKHSPVPPPHTSSHTHTVRRHTHSSSSSSSCNSRRVVRCRARLSNCRGGSISEQSQLVQEEMCVTEQVERRVEVEQDGDTHVEVCRVSRCCSRSEVVAMDSNLRPLSRKSVEDELMMEEAGERPLSAISSSSNVLQSLKEDQDDDLPFTASQCCHSNEPSPSPTFEGHLNGKPTSEVTAGSVHSTETKHEKGNRTVSAAPSCRCVAATPHSTAEAEEMERASCRSSKAKIQTSEKEEAADDEDEEIKRVATGLSGQTGLSAGSLQSGASSVCPNCGGCKHEVNSVSNSKASQRSHHSHRASPKPTTPLSNQGNVNTGSDDDGSGVSAVSTQSNKSNLTNHGCFSATSNVLEGRASSVLSTTARGEEEERATSATSATSHRSDRSHKSGFTAEKERSPSAMSAQSSKSHNSSGRAAALDIRTREEAEGEITVDRALTSLSGKSGASSKTNATVKLSIMVASPTDYTAVEEDDTNKRTCSALSSRSSISDKPDSIMSAKSAKANVSAKSSASHRSTCSYRVNAVSPAADAADEPVIKKTGQEEGIKAEDRAASVISAKSNMSAKSNKSTKASERSSSPKSETGGDLEKRAGSQMSDISNISVKSSKSCKSSCHGNEIEASPILREAEEKENGLVEEAMSAKSQKSNFTTASPNPNEVDSPTTETNAEEKQSQERVASALSIKSKSTIKSSSSHKSNCPKNIHSVSPNTNVIINTPVSVDGEGNDRAERAPSSASAKSRKSNVSSASSQKSNHNRAADVVETDADEKEDGATRSKSSEHIQCQSLSPTRTCSPRTHSLKAPATPSSRPQSPVQQLLPGPSVGETRGLSALSVHSLKSAKSDRSKCRCGAASEKKDKEEDNEEVKSEEASSTKRQRRESGGTEQPLSPKSSGSVSLGLPEDQETAESDSGKSSVSCHVNTQRVKIASPDGPDSTEALIVMENVEGTGSTMSQKSNKNNLFPNPPAVDIPTIETPDESNEIGEGNGEQKTVRAASALSAKSSRSHKSSCKCSVKAAAQMLETGSMKSDSATKASNMDTPNNRTSSAKSSASSKVCSKSPASGSVKKSTKTTPEDSANDTENQIVSRSASKAEREEDITDNKKASVQSKPESAALAKSDPLNQIEGQKAKSRSSVKTSNSEKKEKQVKSSSPCLLHSSRPHSRAGTCSESTLSHSLSAADLLKETMATERPRSRQSKASKTSGKPRSEKSQRSINQTDLEELDLTPACLPNASPSEVVSDWLRSIPTNSSMLGLGDELHEEETVEETSGGEAAKEEGSPEDEKVYEEEKVEAEEEEEDKEGIKCDASETPSQPKALLLSRESLPRNWHSSAAVMKVLLSSSMGRCQSMPEVSPVYGRRLSTSARGFLDCLAQLQLIEPTVNPEQKSHQYEDIMAILQSLWLTEPRHIEAKESKDVGTEQVSPPRSSSGVDMSSGSGSGKENGNQGGDEKERNKTNEAESLHEDEGVERVVAGEKEEGNAEEENKESEDAKTEPAVELEQSGVQSTVPPSLDSPKATENPSSSDSSKTPTDNERETLEDSSSGTPSTVLRAPLSKKLSQDPDPVWILQLLKKLEEQFMNHYSNAMAEFKVRWDLDDSLILDTMISELRDEVSRRIKSSIEREMKKIHSRAGRTGRPPQPPKGGNLSRESTMTEKRRRMLRVMKNQSVKTADWSLINGEMAGDLSDQRSNDEYCPCDACVRKKMAARPLKVNPLAAEAPVMMEFDLLKILQLKKSPSASAVPPPVEEEGDNVAVDKEGTSLEVVQEEEEDETKEDIEADVVLEETIPEEDEEIEKEDGGEAGEDKEVEVGKKEISMADEQEEGETDGEEDETSENVVEEEEEAQCHCQCAKNEEENDKAGEAEEGETANDEERVGEDAKEEGKTEVNDGETRTEEEESDKEKLKKAAAGEGETSENGEEVSESKPEEEENEDDNAAKNASNEEEFTEGNVSASEEDEDDGGDDTGEGGESEEQERALPQGQGVTEGEEADAADSDTRVDEGAGVTDDKMEKECRGDGDEDEEVVENNAEGEVNRNKRDDVALLHQFTRTSVESQPGSLEDIDTDSSPNPVNSIEVPKTAAGVSTGGGAGQRRSRSPARVKRRKPKECNE